MSLIVMVLLLKSCLTENKLSEIEILYQKNLNKIADRDFKTTIGLIELHKLRNKSYPNSLQELNFLNYFDSIAIRDMEYIKVQNGYILNIMPDFNLQGDSIGMANLEYPKEFWQGLGIKGSNLLSKYSE